MYKREQRRPTLLPLIIQVGSQGREPEIQGGKRNEN